MISRKRLTQTARDARAPGPSAPVDGRRVLRELLIAGLLAGVDSALVSLVTDPSLVSANRSRHFK